MNLALSVITATLGTSLVAVTLLPLAPSDAWWVRGWEFPRLQISLLAALVATAILVLGLPAGLPGKALATALLATTLYQAIHIFPYTPLARNEVHDATPSAAATALTVMISNVLMTNRDATRLLALVGHHRPDIFVAIETDIGWQNALAPLLESHPHQIAVPQDNTYGMLFFSRHPLTDTTIDYLVRSDVPSIHTTVHTPSAPALRFHAVHPEPPSPTEADDTTERDAELLIAGRLAAAEAGPVIVAGDLNDVAWSPTTTLFQKTSHLLDPRKGRGLYSSFHAGYPFLRWPLDHLFHSDHFTLVELRRLPGIGSDHFPILVKLALESDTKAAQQTPEITREEEREATGKIKAAAT